ncbi:MAG: ubiquitin-conjugating enzyme/RWD-like protein [Benjaminiella poitrasii]|nr:MAG: ubiquitin-conjugating enzyme/RWD-like protein [Benjaminiella poitrasii]
MTVLHSTALKRIVKELRNLQEKPIEDIQVITNEANLTEIQAWIRGPDSTPYEEGYFKVKLNIDEGFPDTPPKGYFVTKIFHPNVSTAGEICVNTLKKDWKSELGIEHILLTIKCLLIVPNPESALNEEAGRLLLEQYEDYAKRARLYTSIHANSGKSEFWNLSKERLQDQENSNINKTKEESNNAGSNNVLKPLSNTSPAKSNKRTHDQLDNIKEKQDNTKKKIKKIDKKKTLRRL